MARKDVDSNEQIIVDQFDGIVPYFEAFYLESLVYAAGRAVEAFKRFDDAVTGRIDTAVVVANVHEALTHAAAVSRFFWPARQSPITAARAQKLRHAFGLDANSPLYSRDLRNVLEHYDEYLDRFLAQHQVGHFFPGPMVASAALADDQLGNIFRLVDPQTEEFVLLGSKHAFGPMRKAVQEVFSQAQTMMNNGGRLQLDRELRTE